MDDPDVKILREARQFMLGLSADEQAAARRVSIGIIQHDDQLITGETIQSLRSDARAKAAAGRARRAAAREL
eukprot:3157273-Alexandrium_andersonii.AAC.1